MIIFLLFLDYDDGNRLTCFSFLDCFVFRVERLNLRYLSNNTALWPNWNILRELCLND